MPYSSKAIELINTHESAFDKVLADIGKELFNADSVHELTHNSYNIDAGFNDVRAIVNAEKSLICLFCRYEKDVINLEDKLARFAHSHSEQCFLVNVDHKGKHKVD